MRGMFLFQRDLRLSDQVGLSKALMSCTEILLAAVFDPELHKLPIPDMNDHVTYKLNFNTLERLSALVALEEQFTTEDKPFTIYVGQMIPWVVEICQTYHIEKLWINKVNEPRFMIAYEELSKCLKSNGTELICCEDDYAVPMEKIKKDDGSVYKVFTPYYKKWRSHIDYDFLSPAIPEWQGIKTYINVDNKNTIWPAIRNKVLAQRNEYTLKREADYQKQWADFLSNKIERYEVDRDYPGIEGTSQMSLAINNGIISYRQLVREAFLHPNGEAFLRQLAWRQFYQSILVNFPEVETEAFRKEYRRLTWPNDPDLFQKWKDGETGFPIVDAAMKQLRTEGVMHNRLRMISASLLVKQLGVDWRLGEAYFYEMLRDGDLALNNGGWQWCASTGTDAQPYFRIFNPIRQAQRYDPENQYINRWVKTLVPPCVNLKLMSEWTIQNYKNAKAGALEDE